MDKVTNHPFEKGSGYLPRRTFLQALGAVVTSIGSSAVLGWGSLSFSPITDHDMMESSQEKIKPDENARRVLNAVGSKLEVAAAACALIFETEDLNLRDYLLSRYNLNQDQALQVATYEYDNGFSLGDVGIVLRAISESENATKVKVEDKNAFSDDSSSAIGFALDREKNQQYWNEVISQGDLIRPILNLGTRGRNALVNFGFNINSIDIQDRAATNLSAGAEKLKLFENGCMLIENKSNPYNSLVVVGQDGQNPTVYSFDRSRSPEEIKWAMFILDNLGVISADHLSQQDYDSLPVKEFITFQTWVYDYYRDKLSSNPKMTLQDFYIGIHDDLINEKKYPKDHFMEKLKSIEADYSTTMPKEYRYSSLASAANWNIQQFTQVIQSLSPKTRSIFHEKKTQLKEPRTYQMILAEASEGGLTKEKLITATIKYSGNLFLEPVTDRVSSDKDAQILKAENQLPPRSVMSDISSGEMTLMQYADKFFGESRRFILDNEGEQIGVVVTEKIAEPIIEIPDNVLRVLRATEGDNWLKGGDFIKKFITRNLIARFRNDPQSGASSPEMTMFESIFPGPFDKLSAIGRVDKGRYAFRRTDLYGKKYLKKLYVAYRDGKTMPELYQYDYLNSPMSPKDPPENIINKICSKIETAILTRDFVSHFGDKALIDLLAKYVPLGSAKGIQIYGLEAGANYVFNKSLKDLNDGEAAILIGMISSPNRYGPMRIEYDPVSKKSEWVDNDVVCKERAATVLRLCKQHGGFDDKLMKEQIENARLTKTIKRTWMTSLNSEQINTLFRLGVLSAPSVKIGSGISVIKLNEATSNIPDVVGLPRYASAEQRNFDTLMNNLIKPPDFELTSEEKSEISEVYRGATDIIANLDFSSKNWKYEMANKLAKYAKGISYDGEFTFTTSKMADGKVDTKNRNPYDKHTAKYDLYNFLYEAENTQIYQCGQLALVLNALYRIKKDYPMPPMLGSGNVDNWVGDLFAEAKPGHTQTGFDMFLVDVINNPAKAIEDINVGDMVIGWAGTVAPQVYWIGGRQKANTGSGHVATVVNKGFDSQGRTWIEILDSNYLERRGEIRRQIVWGNENMSGLLFPGNSKNFAVIRKSKTDHGIQVPRENSDFVDDIFTFKLNDKDLVLPAMKQKVDVGDGTFLTVKNPGVAVSVFNKDGFVQAYDQTNVLSTLPVMAGNPIRMFFHAFLELKDVDTKQKVNVYPGEYALDGSKDEVRNSTAARMNIDKAAEISLEMALAGSFDVPHQKIFKDMLEKDPNVWSEFQAFLDIFGIPLLKWDGSILDKPTSLATTGRDVYVMSPDKLGYAITSFLNIGRFDNLSPNFETNRIKDACTKTAAIIMDMEKRQNLKIGAFPIIESIGNDVHDQSLSNATVNITTPDGRGVVFIGTRSSFVDTGVIIDPENGSVVVGVAQSSVNEVKTASLYRRASSLFDFGFIDLLRSII